MYDLPYYKEPDEEILLQFIHAHPFAFLSGCDSQNKPVATQVPVFLENEDGKKLLRGHIMRNTDHHKAFIHNQHVLAVFSGSHTYVSATWYSDPHQASTWNYMSVHIHGTLKFLDENGLIEVLRKTSLHFEGNNKTSSTAFDNLPPEYTNRLMKAIAAFEIEVESMQHVFKLSQDRDAKSYEHIIEKLSQQDASAKEIADVMDKRTGKVFPKSES